MKHRGLAARVCGLVAVVCVGATLARAQDAGSSPLPVQEYARNDKGLLVAEVKFSGDGSVSSCRVVRSNVPYPLEASTVDYIRRKWNNPFFAGQTVYFPVEFDGLPWYVKHWDDPLIPPPNFLAPGDPERKLKLRIVFGKDGWAQHVEVEQSSDDDRLDHGAAIWVKVHWHNDAYAGKTIDAPFIFKPLRAPKAAVAKPKVVEPPEDYAPPAVRVE
jgi:hypothetical protein